MRSVTLRTFSTCVPAARLRATSASYFARRASLRAFGSPCRCSASHAAARQSFADAFATAAVSPVLVAWYAMRASVTSSITSGSVHRSSRTAAHQSIHVRHGMPAASAASR